MELRDRFGSQLLIPGIFRLWRRCPIPADDSRRSDAVKGKERRLLYHDVEFLTWTVGSVQRVYARRTRGHGHQSHLTVSLRFTNGMIGHLLHSFQGISMSSVDIEVCSATRTMTVSLTDRDTEQESQDRLIEEYQTLIDHLRTDTPSDFGVSELQRQLTTLSAIDQSLETRSPVSLDEER